MDPEFINADKVLTLGADVLWDLETTPSPFKENQFQLIVASHVLEHVYKLMPLMDELYRILKPGGHLVIFVPYYASHAAIANPEHVRFFTQGSWMFFNQKLNNVPGSGHYDMGNKCDFVEECVVLEPQEEYLPLVQSDPEKLTQLVEHQWNIIKEMCAVLRKKNINETVA